MKIPPDTVDILAVDDRPSCLLVLQHLLSGLPNVRFHSARAAEEAISMAESTQFAVILADVSMDGTDGFQMARALKASGHNQHTPIIFVSACLHDYQFVSSVYRCGAVDSLQKPVVPEVLISKVAVFVNLFLQRRQLKEAVTRQLEMKDRFFAQISHELRTPLNSLYQFLQLFETGTFGPLTGAHKEFIELSLRNATELKSMIEDLMDVARSTTGKLSIRRAPVSIDRLLDDVSKLLNPLVQARKMTLRTLVDDPHVVASCDERRVRQILVNLVTNSIKFGNVGMLITISCRVHPSEVSMVELCVTDQGPGIDADRLPYIFDRLFQIESRKDLHRQGLGLGLFICKELVEAHGGKIDASTPLDGGTEMRFTLPLDLATQPQPERKLCESFRS